MSPQHASSPSVRAIRDARAHQRDRESPRRGTCRRRARNAVPAPTTATSRPPSAGPISRLHRWRANCSNALAWTSCSLAQHVGDRARRAPARRRPRRWRRRARARPCARSRAMSVIASTPITVSADGAHEVGGDHHAAAVHAIGHHAARQQEERQADRPGQTDDRERRGRVGDRVGLPGDRDEIDAVADQRDREARPQQGEVTVAERAEDLHWASIVPRREPSSSERAMIVAIDGPAGAGKSTVARAAAEALGFTYLDTGAMYRSRGARAAARSGRRSRCAAHRHRRARGARRRGRHGGDPRARGRARPPRSVAADPAVRAAMVARQRALLSSGDWVAEGRDIGTVVAPARRAEGLPHRRSRAERARRRAEQTGQAARTPCSPSRTTATRATADARPRR